MQVVLVSSWLNSTTYTAVIQIACPDQIPLQWLDHAAQRMGDGKMFVITNNFMSNARAQVRPVQSAHMNTTIR